MFTYEEMKEIRDLLDIVESTPLREQVKKKIDHLFGCMNAV